MSAPASLGEGRHTWLLKTSAVPGQGRADEQRGDGSAQRARLASKFS